MYMYVSTVDIKLQGFKYVNIWDKESKDISKEIFTATNLIAYLSYKYLVAQKFDGGKLWWI